MGRTILVIAGGVVGALLACMLLLGLLVWTGEPRALTTAASAWMLSQATGTETEVGQSSGSLLRGLELSEIAIGPAQQARFSIRRARLEIEPRALLDGRIEIRLLKLVGLSIEGIQQSDGDWRWAGGIIEMATDQATPDSADDGEGPPILLHRLVLEDVRFHLSWAPGSDGPSALDARLDAELSDLEWPLPTDEGWLPPFEARLSELAVTGGPVPIAHGSLQATHSSGELRLYSPRIDGPWGAIEGAGVDMQIEGDFQAPRVEHAHAEARFVEIDPGSLLEGTWPASDISGTTRFDWQSGVARGELKLEPLTLFGAPVDSAEAHGRVWLESDVVHFDLESLQARAPSGELDARVVGDTTRAQQILIERARIDLGALPDELRPDEWPAGEVALQARLSGPWEGLGGDFTLRVDGLESPTLGTISGEAEGTLLDRLRLRLRKLTVTPSNGPLPAFASKEPFVLGLADGAIDFDAARFDVAGGELGLDGSVSTERFDQLQVHADQVDLARGLRGLDITSVGGSVSGDIVVQGPMTEPRMTGEIDWVSPRAGPVNADRARMSFRPDDASPAQHLHVEVSHAADVLLEADASFSTAQLLQRPMALLEDDTLRLHVEANDLDASIVALAGVPEDQLPQGRLDVNATALGPLVEPVLEGRLDWTNARWQALSADRIFASIESDREVDAEERASAKFDFGIEKDGRRPIHGVLEVADRRLLLRPSQLLTSPNATFEIVFDAFDLLTLDPILANTGVFLRGVADGRVKVVAGAVPDAIGEVRIAGLLATGPALPFDIGPTPARFDFAGQVARAREIALTSADGAARIHAQVSWADPAQPQIQLSARTDSFAVEIPGIIDGRLDGDAVVFGTPTGLTGEGGLLLHHARIDLPDAEDPIFREISVQYSTTDTSQSLKEDRESTLYDALEGQLSLSLGESVWLRSVEAQLLLRGKLVARKERNEPAGLYGNVEVVSGRIDFQGKWLRVTSGSAIFDGEADPDPYIDATAQHQVSDVTITARLFGRSSSLSLELDSNPPMSREDQISYLLFNRPAADLGASEQQSVGATAAMVAGDFILGQVGQDIVQEIGIDRVRLGVDENDSPILEVEKQVHDRVTLRYGRGFGARSGDRFVIEWRLFRELFLSGEQLTNGESGIDVMWRHDY